VAGLLERRYAVSILYAASDGVTRFNEFQQAVGPIPPRTLAARLAELDEAGLLERTVQPTRPPLVEYRLTATGHRLGTVLEALRRWALA
jgi:DNA-binding HxlR family transcriptional regulator